VNKQVKGENAKSSEFNPRQFIADRILPEVVDLPPKDWPKKLKTVYSGLPTAERKAVIEESRRVLAERKEAITAIKRTVNDIRGMMDESGNPLRDRFMGVLVFGSLTGRSDGHVEPVKAMEPKNLKDWDLIPIITTPGRRENIHLPESDASRIIGLHLRVGLMRRDFPPTRTTPAIVIYPDDPEGTRMEILEFKRRFGLQHLKPEPWHFIGEEKTGSLLESAIKGLK
jgi:hypothetical protein